MLLFKEEFKRKKFELIKYKTKWWLIKWFNFYVQDSGRIFNSFGGKNSCMPSNTVKKGKELLEYYKDRKLWICARMCQISEVSKARSRPMVWH